VRLVPWCCSTKVPLDLESVLQKEKPKEVTPSHKQVSNQNWVFHQSQFCVGSVTHSSSCDHTGCPPGARGVLHLTHDSYGIEPLDSALKQHLLYRLQDVTSQPRGCGTPHYEHEHSNATEHAQYEPQEVHHRQHSRLNIRVVLVGLEIWTKQNLISTEGGAGEVLSRFTQMKSFGVTAGMAFVSTVCSRSHGGGINAFLNNNVPAFASIVAHELGHNLGMNHDDGRSCTCPPVYCSHVCFCRGSKNFSSCSADDFEKMILSTGGTCLLNVPRPDDAYSAPFCGNRLVDVGEECDLCVWRVLLQLSGNHSQPLGELGSGTNCRTKVSLGVSVFSSCQGERCVAPGKTSVIYQSTATAPPPSVRATSSSRMGILAGTSRPTVTTEGVSTMMDSAKHCLEPCLNVEEGTVFGIQPSIITTPIHGAKCFGVDFMLGSDVPDPGMVNEGTKCGDNKVCMNFECRNADVLNYDCDVENKCHRHGVCNSNRKCHCDYGWAPPFCELSGYGGSEDSGPTWNGTLSAVHLSNRLMEQLRPIPVEHLLPEPSPQLLVAATQTASSETE
ncbi:hypothetical protein GOODEAATRI_010926, partial [Goodea atripinnis]